MRIIKNQQIVDDSYITLADDAAVPGTGDIIVSLPRFLRERSALLARSGSLGVRLPSDTPPEDLAPLLSQLSLIAIEFPKFGDGRGYTTARILRERLKFAGELRAVGNVLRDQMFYMQRCGFNAFELTSGKSLESALGAFTEFSVTYQAAADDPRPLYRRRAV